MLGLIRSEWKAMGLPGRLVVVYYLLLLVWEAATIRRILIQS